MKRYSLLILIYSSFSLGASMDQAQRIHQVFNQLRADNLTILDSFYHPDVEFLDPIGKHQGLNSVKKYYENLYQNVQEIRFEKIDHIQEGNRHVYIWRMHLRASKLNDGKEVVVMGNSHIIFNQENLVSYHRDYFDMGEFIYDHVPVLGFVIKKVKERLKSK